MPLTSAPGPIKHSIIKVAEESATKHKHASAMHDVNPGGMPSSRFAP
jgi:hypothetical protein